MKWDNTLTFVTQVSIENSTTAAFLRPKLVLNTELIMRGQHFMCEIDFMGISMQFSLVNSCQSADSDSTNVDTTTYITHFDPIFVY